MELERKDQENRLMQKYLDKLCEEEADKLERKHEVQTKLREELNQCNADIIRRKELNKEQVRFTRTMLLCWYECLDNEFNHGAPLLGIKSFF